MVVTSMPDPQTVAQEPLEAKDPFELRVDLSKHVPETDVRSALATGDMGFVHSFTTGSTVDGPGVRVVAWTAGCMFRCVFCHNPDTWTMTNGMPVTIARVKESLHKYRHALNVMSGGVTLSGGEPLMQHRFAVKFLATARALKIHTALDTNGTFGDRLEDAELEHISLVLLGIKTLNPQLHKRLTGMDVGPTMEFARRLAARNRPIWLRYVLIPGLSDDPNDVKAIAKFLAGLGNCERVDVLPFHQMGRYKWQRLGLNYTLDSVEPPSVDLVERTVAIYRAEGLRAY
jgi:pyruvate formate lyase activating enzyme